MNYLLHPRIASSPDRETPLKHLPFAIAAAVSCSIAPPAFAQDIPFPSPDVVDRMCSPQGALGYTFGQTDVPGSTRLEGMIGGGMPLPGEMAPFSKAQPLATEWSNRLMQVTYSARHNNEDMAWMFNLDLADRMAESGWEFLVLDYNDTPLYLAAFASDAVLVKAVQLGGEDGKNPAKAKSARVLASFNYFAGEMTLTCGRDDLLEQHFQEALGNLPEGTPRPEVPVINIPVMLTEAECTEPETVETMREFLKTANADYFAGALVSRTSYRDRLSQWMLWKLKSAGQMSSMEIFELSMDSISKASPDGNPFAALALFEEFIPILERLDQAEKTQDPVALCRGVIPFHAMLVKADTITLAQTEAFQATLTAKARELGVPFD